MKYLVTLRIGRKGTDHCIEWPELEVEAEDKWAALREVVGIVSPPKELSMTQFWKDSSIVKKDWKKEREWRTLT